MNISNDKVNKKHDEKYTGNIRNIKIQNKLKKNKKNLINFITPNKNQ
jgi:hypothetical protein